MPFNSIRAGIAISDIEFDLIYSDEFLPYSELHYTPIEVAIVAARYLVGDKAVKVLDVGSGVGKFCLIGTSCTDGHFTGVELRVNHHKQAIHIAHKHQITQIEFIHSNIVEVSFEEFDAFYFYNPFYEQVFIEEKIDDQIDLQRKLYDEYSLYAYNELNKKPIGTRLATFHSYSTEVPNSYQVKSTAFEGKLKMWEKII